MIQPEGRLACLPRDSQLSTVVSSGPAEDGGFLWVIKIRSARYLRRGSKAVGPIS
jgi:hypothetical protein